MHHIIAIGGGEPEQSDFPDEAIEVDRTIIAASGKPRPRVLFIPAASHDNQDYTAAFQRHYGDNLKCDVQVLKLYDKPSIEEIKSAISNADIIYVGGGNTLRMMTLWRKLGIDKLLTQAPNNPILSGVSAGAVCWFQAVLSDSRSFSGNKDWNYIQVRGLGIHNILLCPHFDKEPSRQPALKQLLKGTNKVAVALDNSAALEIIGDKYRILSSKPGAIGHKAHWQRGQYILNDLKPSKTLKLIKNLHCQDATV